MVTPPVIRIAMIGIALGLAVMILSVAIVIGFKKEIRNKVIGFGSHIQITNFDNNASYESSPIAVSDTLMQHLATFPGGILKTDKDFQGVVLKGVDGNYDWSFFQKNLKEGTVPDFSGEKTSTEVLISAYLANLLELKLGDAFFVYFVQEPVRARKSQIVGIYETGFVDYDKIICYGIVFYRKRALVIKSEADADFT